MTLTKARKIESICKNTDLMKSQAVQAFQSLIEILKRKLESGEDVLISRLGKFCVTDKGVRRGKNPQTGNGLILDARKVLTFKCSKVLKENMNGKG